MQNAICALVELPSMQGTKEVNSQCSSFPVDTLYNYIANVQSSMAYLPPTALYKEKPLFLALLDVIKSSASTSSQ